ncbi:MAG: hypothetical protein LC674_01595, partial [Actinobacteria bacterium]|nr:hypothetical protein [Actinomycetota bacterium]
MHTPLALPESTQNATQIGKTREYYQSLSEKDRRRFAAIEAIKLGHGGIRYIANVLGCDPHT